MPLMAHLYLPSISRLGQPDLVIRSITLSPAKTSFAAGEAVLISVTVENRGTAAASSFWVDLMINPDEPPTTANQLWNKHCALVPCFGMAWYVETGLAAGASVTLTSHDLPQGYAIWPGWFANGTKDIYAYADSYNPGKANGGVDERDESNNQTHLGGLRVSGANPALAGLQSAASLPVRPRSPAR